MRSPPWARARGSRPARGPPSPSSRSSSRIPPVAAPDGLTATLRHYQEAGLSWLWFLHRHGLGGILADDMGLGQDGAGAGAAPAGAQRRGLRAVPGGRPDQRARPTGSARPSASPPGCAVFVWHGQDRRERVEDLAGADLVLTSYALVRRDRGRAVQDPLPRYVILDEAQNIKNAGSATAQACKALPADHRLALTGTPLENRSQRAVEHLRLPDARLPRPPTRTSHERYEQPIEVAADVEARDAAAAARAALRPPAPQDRGGAGSAAEDRDRRLLRDGARPGGALPRGARGEPGRRSRDASRRSGFKRARVSILAALMRLRQVCCDPRLLKLRRAPVRCHRRQSCSASTSWWTTCSPRDTGRWSSASSPRCSGCSRRTRRAVESRSSTLDGRTRDRMARVDAFNRRRRAAHLLHQPQGRRHGPQPHRRRLRHSLRSVVEPGGRGPGHRPHAPHRADPGGHRLQAHHPRHGGGEDPRPAAAQARAGTRESSALAAGCPRASPSRTSRPSSPRSERAASGPPPGRWCRSWRGPCASSPSELNVCTVSGIQGTVRHGTEVQCSHAARAQDRELHGGGGGGGQLRSRADRADRGNRGRQEHPGGCARPPPGDAGGRRLRALGRRGGGRRGSLSALAGPRGPARCAGAPGPRRRGRPPAGGRTGRGGARSTSTARSPRWACSAS